MVACDELLSVAMVFYELLKGPLIYGISHTLMALAFWLPSPHGILAIGTLCAGDGLADVVGRRLGKGNALAWNPQKSAAGSLAFFVGAGLTCRGLLAWHGVPFPATHLWLIAAASAAVESLPFLGAYDNLAVVAVPLLLSHALPA